MAQKFFKRLFSPKKRKHNDFFAFLSKFGSKINFSIEIWIFEQIFNEKFEFPSQFGSKIEFSFAKVA